MHKLKGFRIADEPFRQIYGSRVCISRDVLFSIYFGVLTVEVNSAASVSVDLLDEAIEFIVSQLLVQFPEDLAQARRGNVTVAWNVICYDETRISFQVSPNTNRT